MGKSATAQMFIKLGIPVYDADRCVHDLILPGGKAEKAIRKTFPQAIEKDIINRKLLGDVVFSNHSQLRELEKILHPLVKTERDVFLGTNRRRKTKLVVLDVPLLFENGGDKVCNKVIVVSAPKFLQRQRALSRPNMTESKFKSILSQQLEDKEKRRRADIVMETGLGLAFTFRRVKRYIKSFSLNR